MNKNTAEGKRISADAYAAIRQLIFSGQLRPGEWIPLTAVSERFDVSKTVIREVLSTLVGEKLVELHPGKGFRVAEFDPARLPELTELRSRLEGYALTKSIAACDVDWEAKLVAAHHRMRREPRRDADDPTVLNQAWAKLHAEFHLTLIEGSGVPLLTGFCQQVAAMFELSRLQLDHVTGERDVETEHRQIVDAVLDRDTERAVQLLGDHYRETTKDLLAQWEEAQRRRGGRASAGVE